MTTQIVVSGQELRAACDRAEHSLWLQLHTALEEELKEWDIYRDLLKNIPTYEQEIWEKAVEIAVKHYHYMHRTPKKQGVWKRLLENLQGGPVQLSEREIEDEAIKLYVKKEGIPLRYKIASCQLEIDCRVFRRKGYTYVLTDVDEGVWQLLEVALTLKLHEHICRTKSESIKFALNEVYRVSALSNAETIYLSENDYNAVWKWI